MYAIINILFFLMGISGPTPVVGMRGTTAAFINGTTSHAMSAHGK